MKKSALILSYHFFPAATIGGKRPTELARRLRDEGFQVTAVVSRSKAIGTSTKDDYCDGIRVVYLPQIPSVEDSLFKLFGKLRKPANQARSDSAGGASRGTTAQPAAGKTETIGKRIQRHFHAIKLTLGIGKAWGLMAFFRILWMRIGGRFDVVISSGPPMIAPITAALVTKFFSGKYVIDLRDPWEADPGKFAVYRSRFRQRLESAVREKCLRAADLIVCASPGIRRTVVASLPELSDKTRVILNGYDTPDVVPDNAPEGMLRIIFAGTIYFNRNPLPLFEALQELVNNPATNRSLVRLDLYGDCRSFGDIDLGNWLAAHHLQDCVKLNPPVSFEEIQRQIASSNVLLNFAQGQANQIPAKTYEYLIAGKQTLTITETDSDTAAIIRESGCGLIVAPDDHAGLRMIMQDLYDFFVHDSKRFEPVSTNHERFSRAFQNDRYVEALSDLLKSDDSHK